MKCPKCKNNKCRKAGFACNKQRHECPKCGYKFTRTKPRGKPKSMKKMALKMYLEGMGFRAIGRLLEVSHVSVYRWIREIGELPQITEKSMNTKDLEMDEVHTYVGVKKNWNSLGMASNM